jgi:flagellar hook-associated protein 2
MATLSSAGIGSGLDVNTIVTQLMSIERTPIRQLQTQATALQTKLSSYGKVQSAVAAMRDAASKLTTASTYGGTTASSSDSTSVSVSASNGAAPGVIGISVSKLATSQSVASLAQATSASTMGQGSLTIELGSWNADQSAFSAKTGATAVTINIGAGEDSLAQIRDKINAANAGVSASIVTDASGARLVTRSTATGESNGFRISATETGGSPGLATLAFDPSAGAGWSTQTQAASNANAMIDGLAIVSESNTLDSVIDGLTISLNKTTTSAVNLNIAPDTTSIKKAVTDFATAYNSLSTLLRDQTKYDAASKTAGTLQGDAAAVALQTQLRNLTMGSTSLGGSLSRMADIGLDPGSDGLLTVNSTKLDAAVGKLADLKNFFMATDTATPTNSGMAAQLRSFGDLVLGTEGSITTRQSGLQSRITDNTDRQSSMETRVLLTEKRLRARYTALDTQMASLTSLSAYVTQQIAAMNKTST